MHYIRCNEQRPGKTWKSKGIRCIECGTVRGQSVSSLGGESDRDDHGPRWHLSVTPDVRALRVGVGRGQRSTEHEIDITLKANNLQKRRDFEAS